MQARRIPRRAIDGILLLDKPSGISSNDALQRAKRVFRAAKAGHTGSLDPLATGVLPLCFGEATKLCGVLLESDKRYRATAKLGERTDTGDSEGRIVERSDHTGFDRAGLMAVLPRFLGPISQVPPMYSALKHQGQPLYALAREGIEIERKAREVTIFELDLVEFDGDRFTLDVRCSKGTYIRTLVEDIARAAGQCAHLIALRRTMVVPFEVEKLISFEELDAAAAVSESVLDALLMSPAQGMRHWPTVSVDGAQSASLAQGRAVQVPGAPESGQVAILGERGELLGLGEVDPRGFVAPRRWLHQPTSVRL